MVRESKPFDRGPARYPILGKTGSWEMGLRPDSCRFMLYLQSQDPPEQTSPSHAESQPVKSD